MGSNRADQQPLSELEAILSSIENRADYHSGTAKHLASIDKLLGAAFELMKREPSVERSVFEQLRQLRVRVRFALSAEISKNSEGVPIVAPALWKDRSDKNEDPISFTKRTYSKWIGIEFTRANIKRLDKRLYEAIYNLDNPSEKLSQIGFRTTRQINDLKLSKAGKLKRPPKSKKMSELPPSEKENARLYYIANRRRRSTK